MIHMSLHYSHTVLCERIGFKDVFKLTNKKKMLKRNKSNFVSCKGTKLVLYVNLCTGSWIV